MIRVILADDHPVVLVGIQQTLEAIPDVKVVATVASPDALFVALAEHGCDVLVTDFSMPGESQPDGLAMLQRIHKTFPSIHIVVLTKTATPALMAPIMRTGALAVVEKSVAIKEIANAIERAARGQPYFTQNLQREFALLGVVRSSIASKAVQLSPRETEVIRLFANGYSNNEIAKILGVSAKTTSRQKKDAMRKLAARNDADLYAHAKEMGLI